MVRPELATPTMPAGGDKNPAETRDWRSAKCTGEGIDAEVAERTIALMRAKYGEVTTERQPKSFYGCKLEYGADGSITISLPQKIIEAAREHLPGLIDGRTPKQLELLTGTALQQALDSLELGPARKACKDTTAVQSVTGSLKFSERVHKRLKLPVHRLGCVQSSPVDVKLALRCALSVLAMIWPHRMEGRTWHPHRAASHASGHHPR